MMKWITKKMRKKVKRERSTSEGLGFSLTKKLECCVTSFWSVVLGGPLYGYGVVADFAPNFREPRALKLQVLCLADTPIHSP